MSIPESEAAKSYKRVFEGELSPLQMFEEVKCLFKYLGREPLESAKEIAQEPDARDMDSLLENLMVRAMHEILKAADEGNDLLERHLNSENIDLHNDWVLCQMRSIHSDISAFVVSSKSFVQSGIVPNPYVPHIRYKISNSEQIAALNEHGDAVMDRLHGHKVRLDEIAGVIERMKVHTPSESHNHPSAPN